MPFSYGESFGPMIVDCQWKRSSPTGPAEHELGGSFERSCSSLLIRFEALIVGLWCCGVLRAESGARRQPVGWTSSGGREQWARSNGGPTKESETPPKGAVEGGALRSANVVIVAMTR